MQKSNDNKAKIKVKLEKINKYYYGKKEKVHAVKDLSFHCRDKEFVAMLGPSGCGKSSTLRMIAGLEEVNSGSIHFVDREVTNLHPSRRNIGLAFENYALYPHLSVYENMIFPLRVKGIPEREIKNNQRLHELIELFEIDKNMLDAYPKALSGGQAQLTSLVRCLIRDADVYLLDEPLSHMDEEMRVRMRTTLKMRHHKMKKTFIYVTHDQLEAFALADRIIIMNFGVLQQAGSPQDIYSKPANQFVASFIGEPPMNFMESFLAEENGDLLVYIGEQKIHLPDQFKGKIKPDKKYVLGIRPERVHVSKNPKDFKESMKCYVEIFEYLGEVNQVTVKLGKERIITEISSNTHYEQGSDIFVSFDIDHMHLFDMDTLECIDYKFR
jgi:multiple sugar transport system ATP-binding protein